MRAHLEHLFRFAALALIGLPLWQAAPAMAQPGLAALAPVAPVVSCEKLASTDLSRAVGAATTITRTETRAVGQTSFCIVQGEIAPKVRFEVQLPVKGWTQRFLQVGCGGLCGTLRLRPEVSHADGCLPARNYELVLASTDMGHQNSAQDDGSFGASFGAIPSARIDFAYRGVHVTTLAAKALINAYYGQPARYSYFSGCSDGGREALVEAQRYPDDFDGIAAGAPAMNFQIQNTFYHAWQSLSNTGPDGQRILLAAKLPALHRAALASCDAVDGLKDGQIDDPRACRFNPADAQCKPGETVSNDCLTPAEVGVARKFYDGATGEGGQKYVIGGPQVGSELSWAGVYVSRGAGDNIMSTGASQGTLQYVAFEQNPAAGYTIGKDLRFDRATFDRLRPLAPLYNSTDTDLSGFEKSGGKLIIWHGWSDPHISPINSIAYYQGVQKAMGAARASEVARLFMIPGLYHCNGGDGLTEFDIMSPLMAWVEGGKAPDVLIAGHADATVGPPAGPPAGPPPAGQPPAARLENLVTAPVKVTRTRPVFAYPMQAKYKGSGSIDDAANFVAAAPERPEPAAYDWIGAEFMAPGFQKKCEEIGGKLVCG